MNSEKLPSCNQEVQCVELLEYRGLGILWLYQETGGKLEGRTEVIPGRENKLHNEVHLASCIGLTIMNLNSVPKLCGYIEGKFLL